MSFPNLGKRVLFVLPAIPAGWWLINSNISIVPSSFGVIYPGYALAILLAVLACYEYIGMLRTLYPKNGFWVSYIWLAMQFALYLTDNQLPMSLALYILIMLVAIEAFAWGRFKKRRRWVRASLLFSGTAFFFITAVSFFSFYHEPFSFLFRRFGHPMLSQLGICLIVFAVAMCDTFAYFVGCTWGKRHFSTISPNKTIEGAIGGFVAAVAVTAAGWWFLANPALPKGFGIILGILIGICAQVGDLFVSLMKRYFQVKDSSRLIPGHGGILDRFGSLFFTAPAVLIFSWIVHRMGQW